MIEIEKNFNLKKYNTFGIDVCAEYFTRIVAETDIEEIFGSSEFKNNPKLFLGGGSNILFTSDFKGIVLHNELKGIEIIDEDVELVKVKAYSGEIWNDLVLFTTNRNLWGIENLALIPGTVGGAPMQNIGAYGAELSTTLESVEAYDIETLEKKVFSNIECKLGYRDSIFKQELKGKYFISAIILKLSKKEKKLTEYRVLKEYIDKNNLELHTSKDVAKAVSDIRRSKLPDPSILGNAGSFFKNTYVSKEKLDELLMNCKNIPYFEEEEKIKIPTAWLIEECGFKGMSFGNSGVHDKQALILVNYGSASGKEVLAVAERIISAVKDKFDIVISPEVNII